MPTSTTAIRVTFSARSQLQRVHSLAMFACVVAACSSGAVPALDAPAERLSVKPTVGGQTGVEGSCAPGPWRKIDPDEVRALAAGSHDTTLRWTPWWKMHRASAPTHIHLDFALNDHESERLVYADDNGCGTRFWDPIDVRLHSREAALNGEFTATLSASDRANALVSVDFDGLRLLPAALKSVLATQRRDFEGVRLSLGISDDDVHGSLVVMSGDLCEIARIGSECDPDERAVDSDTAFGNFHASDAIAALQDGGSQTLLWRDGTFEHGDFGHLMDEGTVRLEARLARPTLCIHRVGYAEQAWFTGEKLATAPCPREGNCVEPPADFIEDGAVITIAAELRVVTDDGRLDVWTPVQLRTLASESHGWNGHIEYFGEMIAGLPTLAARGDTIGFPTPEGQVVRVYVSGTKEALSGSSQGGFSIEAMALDSALQDPGEVIDSRHLDTGCVVDSVAESFGHVAGGDFQTETADRSSSAR